MLERVAKGALLFAGCALAAGCAENKTTWDVMADEAEIVRALTQERGVPIVRMSSEQFAEQQAAQAAAIEDEELEQYRGTYGRLGFFDASLDLRAVLGGSSSDWVAGVYSSQMGTITVIGEPEDHVIVHEMVHALQDQHFGLSRYTREETTDARVARRAVVEGDATLAQTRFFLRSEHGVDLDQANYSKWFDALRAQSAETLATTPYPVIFSSSPAFLYTYGTMFCAHNLTGHHPADPYFGDDFPYDWGLEDELFTERPPATSEQILRVMETGDSVEIGLDDVPPNLTGKLRAIDWDTLGAWYTYLLLLPTYQPELFVAKAQLVAERWEGDRVLFVEDETSGKIGVVWASAWSDDGFAHDVENGLRQIHGVTAVGDSVFEGFAADGEPVWIEQRGARLAFLKNVAKEHAAALVDAAIGAEQAPMISKGAGRPRARPSLAAWVEERTSEHH